MADSTKDRSQQIACHKHDYHLRPKLSHFKRLLSAQFEDGETTAHNELSFATEDLIVYLNNHVYASVSFAPYSNLGPSGNENANTEIIHQVKSEIRRVKGEVLNMYNHPANFVITLILGSSRNFPAPAIAGT
jgi:hypothetical protein